MCLLHPQTNKSSQLITLLSNSAYLRRYIFNYNQANFPELCRALSQTDFSLVITNDIDQSWKQWRDLFLSIVNVYVPTKTLKDTNSPPWIDGEVPHLIRKKYMYTALRKYRMNKTTERKLKIRSLCQQVKYIIRNKHKAYLSKVEASLKENTKMFWNYHKAKLQSRSAINPVISYDNQVAKTPKEKAELFNSYFCSVFRLAKVSSNHDPSPPSLGLSAELSDITVSEDEVACYLSSLDPTKASGPDGIPCRILRECRSAIAPSLCLHFNQSLSTGSVPCEWKSADVTPIHKKGNKETANNYRPISLLPIIIKILERCVCTRLNEHFRDVINNAQHGFLRGRSCVTQLLGTLHQIGKLLDQYISTSQKLLIRWITASFLRNLKDMA